MYCIDKSSVAAQPGQDSAGLPQVEVDRGVGADARGADARGDGSSGSDISMNVSAPYELEHVNEIGDMP